MRIAEHFDPPGGADGGAAGGAELMRPGVILGPASAVDASVRATLERLLAVEAGLGQITVNENGGRGLAELIRWLMRSWGTRGPIAFLIGPFSTGASGLVAARHLSNAGIMVRIVLAGSPRSLGYAVEMQLGMLERMGVRPIQLGPRGPGLAVREVVTTASVLVDALLGGGLCRLPRGHVLELVQLVSGCVTPVVSVDYPTGVHPDTGGTADDWLRATSTAILGLPVACVVSPGCENQAGDRYLLDIGVPRFIYDALGAESAPWFMDGSVVRVV